MASIIYRTDRKTGYTYAYESYSYRDPVTKKPRTKQTYIGRVDPVTKEIRPKGENGKRNRVKLSVEVDKLKEQIVIEQEIAKKASKTIEKLKARIDLDDQFYAELKGMIARYERKNASGSELSESSETGGCV